MPTFPLPFIPKISWHRGGGYDAYFGAGRPKDPRVGIHGACDLAGDPGTPIFAVEDGTITRGPYEFVKYADKKGVCHSVTYAIEVKHQDFIVRYCEIAPHLPKELKRGSDVEEGQIIATIGIQCGMSMLHFEMFKNTDNLTSLNENRTGNYLYVPKADYRRREDLLDPTDYLDDWAASLGRNQSESHRQIDDADYNLKPGSYPPR